MHQRIRDLRNDAELSQKQMAALLNVAQTTYSDYEHGRINIPLKTLKQLAFTFDTSIDYLLGVTDVMTPYPRAAKDFDTP